VIQLKESTHSMDTCTVFIKKGTGFHRFIKKSRLFYGNSYCEKKEGRPYSFLQVSVQKIRNIKVADLQKVRFPAPILQIDVYEYGLKESTMSCISLC
jgi:hypothetical protein